MNLKKKKSELYTIDSFLNFTSLSVLLFRMYLRLYQCRLRASIRQTFGRKSNSRRKVIIIIIVNSRMACPCPCVCVDRIEIVICGDGVDGLRNNDRIVWNNLKKKKKTSRIRIDATMSRSACEYV